MEVVVVEIGKNHRRDVENERLFYHTSRSRATLHQKLRLASRQAARSFLSRAATLSFLFLSLSLSLARFFVFSLLSWLAARGSILSLLLLLRKFGSYGKRMRKLGSLHRRLLAGSQSGSSSANFSSTAAAAAAAANYFQLI